MEYNDDEDSEVEMLSISSGDEDSDEDLGVKSQGGGGRKRKDDPAWDGGEPIRWKHVDENELARRVRVMREARTAPVAQKAAIDRKASSGMVRPGLNTMESLPRGMECIDPLGLGIIDNRSLRLITVASATSPKSKDVPDQNLREKLIYFSEKFDAKLFLSRIHQDTSAADLEAGAIALQTDLQGRTQQRKQLVKNNFDCFVSCKTTIDDIESKLKEIEEDPEGSGTSHLFNVIQGVTSQANRALEPLFERQAQAEKIRSVQGMLQRFRMLFNLPSTIRGHISKGDFDLAVREYKKAKSIALPSHVEILKRVLEEVETVMQEFKGTLFKSMEDPRIELTNLENTVRLLLELEPESDPVWHYLSIQNNRVRGSLEKCTLDHESRMETLQHEAQERVLSDAKWRQIQQDSSQSTDSAALGDANLLVESPQVDLKGEEVDALRGRYIRRLSLLLIHQVPAFWKVGLAVFSDKFAKSSQVSSESNVNEKMGDGKYSIHSLDEVAGMIRNTITVFEAKVSSTFRDLEQSNVLLPYMSNAIEEVYKTCQAFEEEATPPATGVALRLLHAELTKIYISRLCSWMRASLDDISDDETWIPISILERNKSPFAISFLPLAFRSATASAMDRIDLMVQSLRREAEKSEDIFLHLEETQESIRIAVLNCFLDFAGCLENIASGVSQNKESPYLQNGYSHEAGDTSLADIPGSVVDPHQQLLIVLSNTGYCRNELSYELYNKYKHIWLDASTADEDNRDLQDLGMCFSSLEEKVLEQYTFAKASLIRTAAANYLLDSGVQWGAAPSVKGVRDAAVELLHTLVAIHAELFAGAKPLLDKTLGILVEGLIDTFLSLFHENEHGDLRSLDANGYCQLMLELEYFETILNPFFTRGARESLKSLQGVLLVKATESLSGTEDADDRPGMNVSPDDLIALAQQHSSELLQAELERTHINAACFAESIPLDSVPEQAKAAYIKHKRR